MNDVKFDDTMEDKERNAWLALKSIIKNFLGNHKSPEYEQAVEELLRSYQALGARMSIKIALPNLHLDYFPENCGDYSEEQGERFHRDIRVMEERKIIYVKPYEIQSPDLRSYFPKNSEKYFWTESIQCNDVSECLTADGNDNHIVSELATPMQDSERESDGTDSDESDGTLKLTYS
ncbi:hypothetical protein ANN_07793 [Periplaneta americana]|uniref:Uncharacterized protein n=1 Tax=Periplaneta americana TaxID=6978 RepID=A0ABQ8T1U7_PERAM|nr:hypothetical protein ANN_07793 [Periplaneta americana]